MSQYGRPRVGKKVLGTGNIVIYPSFVRPRVGKKVLGTGNIVMSKFCLSGHLLRNRNEKVLLEKLTHTLLCES